MIPSRADTPHVPLTPTEIANDTCRAYRQGASVVHVHARDDDGEPTYKKEVYSDIFSKIRKKCPHIIICASTSGRNDRDIAHRAEVLELEPEMASLTPGCVNFFNRPSINTLADVIALAKMMDKLGVKPELEIFEPGLINTAKYLLAKGHLHPPLHFNLLLGSPGGIPAGLRDLIYLVDSLPSGCTWSATGIGKYQFQINAASVLMSGHVRVGLEDSIYYDKEKRTLATNEQLVSRIVRIAADCDRKIATPKEARLMLSLK
jgi:3-keto-5-aminohexanoate cleavage enzyme